MIYISYGQPKSGSTAVFQFTLEILKQYAEDTGHKVVYLDYISKEYEKTPLLLPIGMNIDSIIIEAINKIANNKEKIILIFKTHHICSEKVRKLIADGTIMASASFRYPLEKCYSAIDDKERGDYSSIHETIDGLRSELILLSWLKEKKVEKFSYGQISNQPFEVAQNICKQLKIDTKYSNAIKGLVENKNQIWTFHKGDRKDDLKKTPKYIIEAIELLAPLSSHSEDRNKFDAMLSKIFKEKTMFDEKVLIRLETIQKNYPNDTLINVIIDVCKKYFNSMDDVKKQIFS